MKKRLINIWTVIRREVELLAGDKNIILIVLVAPVFYAFFYSTIYLNKIETNVQVAVVDQDKTYTTQRLINHFNSHQLIEIYAEAANIDEAERLLNNGEVQGIIYIPRNFEDELKSGKGAFVKVGLNTTRFLVSNDLNKAINEVIEKVNAGVKLKYFEAKGYNSQQSRKMIEPIHTDIRPLFNYTESYGDFLVPGMLVLILQQTLLIGLSESMAKEREKRLLQDLFRASGDSTINSILGKGLFYLFLYAVYALFFYSITFAVLSLQFAGSNAAVLLLTLLLLLSVIFLSLFFSSFLKRKLVALQIFAFSSYPVFLLSGYSWPLESMPVYIRAISYMLPSTPYLNAFQRVTQMGAGIGDVLPEIFHLTAIIIAALVLSVVRFKNLFNHIYKKTNISLNISRAT